LATDRHCQTDKLTDKQMDSSDALSRSRCRERRLNKQLICHRETERRFVSLNILLSHSRSLKVI